MIKVRVATNTKSDNVAEKLLPRPPQPNIYCEISLSDFFFDGYQNHLANLFDVVLRIIKTETSVDCIVCEVAAAYHEALCPGRFGNFKFA